MILADGSNARSQTERSPADRNAIVGRRTRLLVLFVVLASFALATTSAQPGPDVAAIEQIDSLLAEKASRTQAQLKIDSRILLELRMRRGDPDLARVPYMQSRLSVNEDGTIVVDVKAHVTSGLLARIDELGGSVESAHAEYASLRARVPLDQIETLASRPELTHIRPAHEYGLNMINMSEGDVAHAADVAKQALGINGNGVNIGVMSDSVDQLATLQMSNDLPAVTVLAGQSGNPATSEGTAMLEIVFDLAPGANLFFATASGGQANFAANILALAAAGCDIIVDDIFYFAEPVFQDGVIAQAVETVNAMGIQYYSAVGNAGNLNDGTSGVWEGDFLAAANAPAALAGQTVHDFGGGTNANRITRDSPFSFTLFWSDPDGGSGNDYDLFLLDPTGTNVIASSTNVQNGNDDAFEIIASSNAMGNINDLGNLLVIVQNGGAAGRYLHLNTIRGRLAMATAGQAAGHPCAANAFGTAAVNVATAGGGQFVGGAANPVETFSSDGPRRIFFDAMGNPLTPGDVSSTGGVLRQKPDITAADQVATATVGFNPFGGTSAAAPHAAAIGALLLELDNTLTPAQVRTLYNNSALDIEAPGPDRDSGVGIVMADLALQQINPPPVAQCQDVTVNADDDCLGSATAADVDDGSFDPDGEDVTLSLDPAAPYALGDTDVTLTATDEAGWSSTCTAVVTVVDVTPPDVTCPAPVTVECTAAGGTPSDDPQLIDFFNDVSATDNCDANPAITDDAPALLPLGDTTVTFSATDDDGNVGTCHVVVTVEDTTPPEIDVVVDPDMLWPPNHKMVPVSATVTVTDICDPNPSFVLTSVTSDEPDNGRGDGNTVNDIQSADLGEPDVEILLRAERQGSGDGRVYTIRYTAMDLSGNTADAIVFVRVPHDRRAGDMELLIPSTPKP